MQIKHLTGHKSVDDGEYFNASKAAAAARRNKNWPLNENGRPHHEQLGRRPWRRCHRRTLWAGKKLENVSAATLLWPLAKKFNPVTCSRRQASLQPLNFTATTVAPLIPPSCGLAEEIEFGGKKEGDKIYTLKATGNNSFHRETCATAAAAEKS